MSKIASSVIILVTLMLVPPFYSISVYAKTFVVGYGSHDSEPYAIIRENQLVAGIIKEIVDEIALELKINVEYVNIPRKREELYLQNGRIDAIIISNPKWLMQSERFHWSEPLFVEQDLLVTLNTHNPKITNISAMTGMNIGTIRGYIYPTLAPLFENNTINRSDTRSIQSNFTRLQFSRIDGFIDSNFLIYHYLHNNKVENIFKVEPVIISEHGIQTALSANSPITKNQFDFVLNKLKEKGIIKDILNKYHLIMPSN